MKTFHNLISESLENLSSYSYKRSENCSAVIHTLDLWAGKKWTTTHLQGELLSHKNNNHCEHLVESIHSVQH
jgi:hypothetical protein